MNKSRRTGCKFLEAADRTTWGQTGAGASDGDGWSGGDAKVVYGATICGSGRRPPILIGTNAAKIPATAGPGPGSRKMRPLK